MNTTGYTGWELSRAVDALMAYHAGSSSVAHDADLEAGVGRTLKAMVADDTFDDWATSHARRILATEGYGLADVVTFVRWLEDAQQISF